MCHGLVIALGGGLTSNINMGIVNTTTGAVTKSNITGVSGPYPDYVARTSCAEPMIGAIFM